jgi:hypothetical protein
MLELYRGEREDFLAKIAVELDRALEQRAVTGGPGRAVERKLARGDGWTVSDVICTCTAYDRPFEEQHKGFSIVAGDGRQLSIPGLAGTFPEPSWSGP